jgi:hypothetical protein
MTKSVMYLNVQNFKLSDSTDVHIGASRGSGQAFLSTHLRTGISKVELAIVYPSDMHISLVI